jgi:transaldolase
LLAAKAGAAYVSPFIGRLDDVSTDGVELIRKIVEVYNYYEFSTQVLADSIRHTMHIIQCLEAEPMLPPVRSVQFLDCLTIR